MSDAPQPPAALPPRRRRRWPAVLLALVLLLAGGVIGSGLTLLVAVRQVRERIVHPELFPPRATARLKSKLDLSDQQAEQVLEILTARQANIQALRREVQPNVEAELDAVRDEVSAVLNAEQAATWQHWLDDKRAFWLPPLQHPPATSPSP